jgi:hypothetical protein
MAADPMLILTMLEENVQLVKKKIWSMLVYIQGEALIIKEKVHLGMQKEIFVVMLVEKKAYQGKIIIYLKKVGL